ncbi:MAG: glycosyltransferase [Bryobacterales bacterium]|nr:glycosyltransferase [Bryobacterales bacterium]
MGHDLKPFPPEPRLAVLIPCYNEEAAIATVVRDFRKALPSADIYVYDNNSKDNTCAVAAKAGAIVRNEPQQGKGSVMRRMLSEIDADVFITVDGDDTYDAASAPALVKALVDNRLAMVVGRRVHTEKEAYRRGHVLGNLMFTRSVEWLFGRTFTDILSGYRVFSRPFVRSFPTASRGFEIETELTVHALTLSLPVQEQDTPYKSRPEGSVSKLHTYRDGWRISLMILRLFRTERPQLFYTLIGSFLMSVAVILMVPVIIAFLETGLVLRFPTAILSTGIAIAALLSFACGLILDTVTQGRREAKMLAYLAAPRMAETSSR